MVFPETVITNQAEFEDFMFGTQVSEFLACDSLRALGCGLVEEETWK